MINFRELYNLLDTIEKVSIYKRKGKEIRMPYKVTTYQLDNHWNKFISASYEGQGFYVQNIEKAVGVVDHCYEVDRSWCYGYHLVNDQYPITSIRSTTPTELGVHLCSLHYATRLFPQFYYNLYMNIWDKKHHLIYLNNKDYNIFNTLYDSDIKILDTYWFKDIGQLNRNFTDRLLRYYDKRQELKKKDPKSKDYKELKLEMEMIAGMFAYDYGKSRKNKDGSTRLSWKEGIRSPRVCIATFLTAYAREVELKYFLENIDNTLYMNTDSLISLGKSTVPTGKELGDYKVEFSNRPVDFIRNNGYIIHKKDGWDQVIGGFSRELTPEDVEYIKSHEEGLTWTEDGQKRNISYNFLKQKINYREALKNNKLKEFSTFQ